MLALIGMGLGFGDISLRSIKYLKDSDEICAEEYTTILEENYIDKLSKSISKKITKLQRSDLEERAKETVANAKKKRVAILVPGDPLIATTHHILLDEAHNQGVETRIYHSASAFSAAIGESGLDIYRFGPPITIPYWKDNYRPTSFLNVLEANLSRDQHTLLFLDINQDEKRPMSINEATKIIQEADKKRKIIDPEKIILVLCNLGREDQTITYIKYSEIRNLKNNANSIIIVPAELNFAEEESLKKFMH